MKALSRIILAAIVVALAAAGVWYVRGRAGSGNAAARTSLSQTVDVRQGTLTANITVVGELEAVQSENLTFSRMKGSAPLLSLAVQAGNTVKAGQTLATIDPAPYQQTLDQARSDLEAAEKNLVDLQTPATALDISKADVSVAKAQRDLEQAKENLASTQSPDLDKLRNAVLDAEDKLALAKLQQTLAEHDALAKSERDLAYAVSWHERRAHDLRALVASGRANVEQTASLTTEQEKLGQAQADLARVQSTRHLSLQAAAAETAKAAATLADAREALAKAQAGGDKLALAKAQLAVREAEVSVASANDTRAKLDTKADATTLAAAQADVDKKRLAVADAAAALAGASLVAPFDGTVLQTRATVGNLVGPTTQIMTVANLKNLQVAASVDETSIRRVQVGQAAQITFDALPGQTLRGQVLSVPMQGALQGNVMVYEVALSLTGAQNLPLLVGMTANVRIQVGQATNALLVPTMALQESSGRYQVLVQNPADPSGEPQAVAVEVGLSDGTNTQIVKGLNAGDKVVVRYATTSSTTAGQTNRNTGFSIFQFMGRR